MKQLLDSVFFFFCLFNLVLRELFPGIGGGAFPQLFPGIGGGAFPQLFPGLQSQGKAPSSGDEVVFSFQGLVQYYRGNLIQ